MTAASDDSTDTTADPASPKGILPGDGILPGSPGQVDPGSPGQVDRGSEGQIAPGAEGQVLPGEGNTSIPSGEEEDENC